MEHLCGFLTPVQCRHYRVYVILFFGSISCHKLSPVWRNSFHHNRRFPIRGCSLLGRHLSRLSFMPPVSRIISCLRDVRIDRKPPKSQPLKMYTYICGRTQMVWCILGDHAQSIIWPLEQRHPLGSFMWQISYCRTNGNPQPLAPALFQCHSHPPPLNPRRSHPPTCCTIL